MPATRSESERPGGPERSIVRRGSSRLPRKWAVFAAVGFTYFLSVLTATFSVLAIPAIADDFEVTLRTVGWVVIVESLIVAALLLPMGGLSDVVGRHRTLRVGVAVFGLGLILTGVAPSFPLLILARTVTALGNTLIQAVGTGILVAAFPRHERGMAIGAQTTAVGFGAAAGPLLGGLLLDELDWQLLFLMLAAPTALAFVVVARTLDSEPRVGTRAAQGFDWPGAGLSAGAIIALVVTLNDPFGFGAFSTPIAAVAIATIILLVGFVRVELRRPRPMLDVRLFSIAAFRQGVLIRVVTFTASTALVFLAPIYLLSVRDYATRDAGLILTLSALGMVVGGQISGRLYDRVGPRLPTMFGLLLQAGVLAMFATVDAETALLVFAIGTLANGLGLGFWNVGANSIMLGATPPESLGVGGAFTNVTRTVGNVIGQAGATAIVASVMASKGFDIPLGDVADTPGAGAAFIDGWQATFTVATVVCLVALAIAARIPGGRPSD